MSLRLFVFPLYPFKRASPPLKLQHTDAPPPVTPQTSLLRIWKGFCETPLAEQKRVVISAGCVCLQMMSPPHYNERGGGGDGSYQVSGEDRGVEFEQDVGPFPCIVI